MVTKKTHEKMVNLKAASLLSNNVFEPTEHGLRRKMDDRTQSKYRENDAEISIER